MSKECPEINDVFIGPGAELWFVKEIKPFKAVSGNSNPTITLSDPYAIHPDREISQQSLFELMRINIIKFGWTGKEAKKWKS